MKTFGLVALLLLVSCIASTAKVIDRIVAVVNRDVILQSDWEEAVRYEAFMAGKPLAEVTPTDAKGALDRLIDQKLLFEQMQGFRLPAPSAAEVNDKLSEVRKLYPDGSTDTGWNAALARYDLSEKAVNARLANQLEVMEFIDMRLRPEAKIAPQAVDDYYREKLLPQLGDAAKKPSVPDADVTAKIQELLTQEKIDELLTTWLHGLREQAELHVHAGPEVLIGSSKTLANQVPAQHRAEVHDPQVSN